MKRQVQASPAYAAIEECMDRPCSECPFRANSEAGYLGGHSLEATMLAARTEGDFLCHLTRDTKEVKQCAGRLLYAEKVSKKFRHPKLFALAAALRKKLGLKGILDRSEFMERHAAASEEADLIAFQSRHTPRKTARKSARK